MSKSINMIDDILEQERALFEFFKKLIGQIFKKLGIYKESEVDKTARLLYKCIKNSEQKLHKMYKKKGNRVVDKKTYYGELVNICKLEKKNIKFLAERIVNKINKERIQQSDLEKLNIEDKVIEELERDIGRYIIKKIAEGFNKPNSVDVKMYIDIVKDLHLVLDSSYDMFKDKKYIKVMHSGIEKIMREEVRKDIGYERRSGILLSLQKSSIQYGVDTHIKADDELKQAIMRAIDNEDIGRLDAYLIIMDIDNSDNVFFNQKIRECLKKRKFEFLDRMINYIRPEILEKILDKNLKEIFYGKEDNDLDMQIKQDEELKLEIRKDFGDKDFNRVYDLVNSLGKDEAIFNEKIRDCIENGDIKILDKLTNYIAKKSLEDALDYDLKNIVLNKKKLGYLGIFCQHREKGRLNEALDMLNRDDDLEKVLKYGDLKAQVQLVKAWENDDLDGFSEIASNLDNPNFLYYDEYFHDEEKYLIQVMCENDVYFGYVGALLDTGKINFNKIVITNDGKESTIGGIIKNYYERCKDFYVEEDELKEFEGRIQEIDEKIQGEREDKLKQIDINTNKEKKEPIIKKNEQALNNRDDILIR